MTAAKTKPGKPSLDNLMAKLLLKGPIRKAIRMILEYLATKGEKVCKALTYTHAPLTIK